MNPRANVEFRICYSSKPLWGFVADGMFFPIGPEISDKKLAADTAKFYKKNEWVGVSLSECGPNLDILN